MKKHYLLIFVLALIGATANAQEISVPANLDGTEGFPFTYVDVFIEADTNEMGVQQHDVYLLERGGFYFFTALRRWDFDVALRATGDESLPRPILDRANTTGGTSLAPMYRGFGDFSLEGLYVIMGDEGPTASNYELAFLRPEGDGVCISIDDCILEKVRQAVIRIEGENVKASVTNSIIRNLGDYERFQGNGRIVDTRDNFGDSVIIRNNVVHNLLDRAFIGFRQQGLNYFEFSQNTIFNHVGRHGFIQLKNTKESVIKDNFIMNPSMMGTSPALANEQINHVGVTNYLFSIDTLVEGASLEMGNNNVFWTDDVLSYYANSDSVTQPMILSPEIIDFLGDTTNAYFTEVLELNNVPGRERVIKYIEEAIQFQDSVGITNMMVEDVSLQGTDFDKGYLFDFSAFDPCYDPNSISATASTEGDAVGAIFLCPSLVSSTREEAYNPNIALKASPNPTLGEVILNYNLQQSSRVRITVFDMSGKKVASVLDERQPAGEQQIRWNGMATLSTGMYIAHLQSEFGRMYVKIFKQ